MARTSSAWSLWEGKVRKREGEEKEKQKGWTKGKEQGRLTGTVTSDRQMDKNVNCELQESSKFTNYAASEHSTSSQLTLSFGEYMTDSTDNIDTTDRISSLQEEGGRTAMN